jgi:hypothetical protein
MEIVVERCGRALRGLDRLQASLVGDLLAERHVAPVVVPLGLFAADEVRETEKGDGPASVGVFRAPRGTAPSFPASMARCFTLRSRGRSGRLDQPEGIATLPTGAALGAL